MFFFTTLLIFIHSCKEDTPEPNGCHNSDSSKGDYTTFAGIKAKADNGSLLERVVEKRNMPREILYHQRIFQNLNAGSKTALEN